MLMLELAHLRNRLAVGKFGEYEQALLDYIQQQVKHSDSPFAKIILTAVRNCVADVECQDFTSATREIHLVHNFPVFDKEYSLWDEKHFYQIELLSYIEDAKNVNRIKQFILLLAEAITLYSVHNQEVGSSRRLD